MFVHRRRMLQLAALAAFPGWPPMAQIAHAQSYPTKPVRFMVGFPANGPNSILAGLAGDWLTAKLGQPFAVEHKPGQSGNIATAEVVGAPADGYTILLCGPANAIGASLYPNLPYNFLRDMVPVAGITREALVLVVNPGVPAKTVPELLALAKANPRAIKIASTGSGSAPHVTAELFKQLTSLNFDVVHYRRRRAGAECDRQRRGADDVRADVGSDHSGARRQAACAGRDHHDAVARATGRADGGRGGAGLRRQRRDRHRRAEGHTGDVVELLNKIMQTAFADPGFQAKVAETGGVPLPGSSADFARLMTAETEKWGKVVKAAGIKAE